MRAAEVSLTVVFITGLLGQATGIPNDWTHIASLPFAFSAAAFLIWSMVQLFRMMFTSWSAQSDTTIASLRDQIMSLRKYQEETLTHLVNRVATALEADARSTQMATASWNEVHEDFRVLVNALRIRPCLHDSDFTGEQGKQLDPKAVERIQHRQKRQTDHE